MKIKACRNAPELITFSLRLPKSVADELERMSQDFTKVTKRPLPRQKLIRAILEQVLADPKFVLEV